MASAYLTWSNAVNLVLLGTLANQWMTNTQINSVTQDVERMHRDVDRLSADVREILRILRKHPER